MGVAAPFPRWGLAVAPSRPLVVDQGPADANQTRARILTTALSLITEQGVAATTLRQISRRLDLSVAALYYYYPAKDDLVTDLMAPYLDGFDEIVTQAQAQGQGPQDTVGFVLKRIVGLVVADPGRIRVATTDLGVLRHPLMGPALEARARAVRQLLGASPDVPGSEILTAAALAVLVRPVLNVDDVAPALAYEYLIPAAQRVLEPLTHPAATSSRPRS